MGDRSFKHKGPTPIQATTRTSIASVIGSTTTPTTTAVVVVEAPLHAEYVCVNASSSSSSSDESAKKKPKLVDEDTTNYVNTPTTTITTTQWCRDDAMLVVAKPDITHTVCNADDFVLVACDGIFEPDSFTNDEIISFVSQKLSETDDLGIVLSALCNESLKRGSTDNMTALLITFGDGSNDGPLKEYIVGPFSSTKRYLKAYVGAASQEMGWSPGETLQSRYDCVKKRLLWLKENGNNNAPYMENFDAMQTQDLCSWLCKYGGRAAHTGGGSRADLVMECKNRWRANMIHDDLCVSALEEELRRFDGGPPDNLYGNDRTGWFEHKYAHWTAS
jgi:hypothetical protein